MRLRLAEFRRVRAPLLAAGLLLLFRNAFLSFAGVDQRMLQSRASDTSGRGSSLHSAASVSGSWRKVLLYWTKLSDSDDLGMGLGSDPFRGCPVSSCVATDDRGEVTRADAVLFDSRELDETDLPLLRRAEQKLVFFAMESPRSTNLNLTGLDGFFNLTMTYRRDADIYQPFGETMAGAPTQEPPDFQQRKLAAVWMASTCETPSQRENYIRELGKYIFLNKVGPCGQQDCNASVETCYRRQAADSLFALSFESSQCDDFITDQFWLALRAGLVPVVRGPDPEAYRRVAPPRSFIHVQQFGGPHGLATHLVALSRNRTAYEEYRAWRATHHVRGWRWNACDLCAEMWKEPPCGGPRSVRISDVWSPREHCRESDDLGYAPRLL